MSKAKISLIVFAILAVIAGVWIFIYISQKDPVQPAVVNQPIHAEAGQTPSTKEIPNQTDTIDLKISSFQKTPSLIALTNVENAIRQQLPLISLTQRYGLLDKWEKILTPIISRLDPEQGKLLTVYGTIEYNYIEGESPDDRRKRFQNEFNARLNAQQRMLLQQLTAHQIEITEVEEVGPVFKLKPIYWKELFASSLTESDQKFWKQKAFENDPVIDFDAGLAVERVTLGDWAFSWEQYLKKYQNSYYQKQAEENYQSYMRYLLTGLENTATLADETNQIDPDVDANFDTIIKQHPHSAVASSITAFRKKIKEYDGQSDIRNKLYDIANSVIRASLNKNVHAPL
jgi:hypothetical protein